MRLVLRQPLLLAFVLLAIPLAVLAQTPTPDDPIGFISALLLAAQTKQYMVLGVLATVGLVWLARWGGTKIPGAVGVFLGTRRGGALLALLGGLATAFAIPAFAHTPITSKVLLDALVYGIGSAGGWTVVRRLFLGDSVVDAPVTTTTPGT